MQMIHRVSDRFRLTFAVFAAAGMVFLSGCANMIGTAPATNSFSNAAAISGTIHGGQQPVYNAVVRLYSAGTSGYGVGSILLATSANSGLGGEFSFTKDPVNGGPLTPSTPNWSCPVSGDPVIYISAIGGNTQGTQTTAVNNSASALLAVLGHCSAISSSTHVGLNEISTVASVFALSQYMNPGTTPGTETVGTSSTAQGIVGLSNAAASIANLANITNGAVVSPPVYTGAGTAAGVTVTATAEQQKIVTIANILAACINSPTSANSACADLFASATPPASASITSQPAATFATAQDTIQAAYYMAINPGNIGTFSSCSNGATTKTGCLFNLATPTSPFQPGLSAAPSDWTIGVTYTASGTCSGGGKFIDGPYHAGVDAAGNVWFINGNGAGTNLSEMSSLGQPLVCAGALSNGRGLTIDVSGNVWGSFNGTATNGVVEWPAGGSALTVWPVTAAQQTYEMTSDGFGNVFYNVNAGGGSVWEFVNAGSTTTPVPFASTQIAGPLSGSGTITQGYIQVDSQGRIWDDTSTSANLFQVYPKVSTTAAITGFAVTGGAVTFTATNTYATGNVIQVAGLTTSAGTTLNSQTYTVTTATPTSFTASTAAPNVATTADNGTAALTASYSQVAFTPPNTAYGIAIDANNYVFQGTTCCAGAGDKEFLKWTPGATATATVSASAANFGGISGTRAAVVDGAGNAWFSNEYPTSAGSTNTSGTAAIVEVSSAGSGTTATFTAISPPGITPTGCSTSTGCITQGGYFKADFSEPLDMQVDPSGNLWVLNSGTQASPSSGTSITEVIGAAVPVVTPLSVAVKNNQLGTKP